MTFHLDFKNPAPGTVRHGSLYRLEWDMPLIMGIVNITPDSFSDGGRSIEASIAHALKLEADGARILDLGGESTRPGATPVDPQTELERVIPVLRALRGRSSALLSVDTRKPEVARLALENGAHLINDITGLTNPEMLEVCATAGATVALMHMQGEPRTMQLSPQYGRVLPEVSGFLEGQARVALEAGIPGVILDPGIGFGKSLEHNLELLRRLEELTALGFPLLIGASRKSTIAQLSHAPVAADRDPGSVALHLGSVQKGAAMLRVHNVAMHKQALEVWWTVWGMAGGE